jgi:hypothetical protein
MLPTVPQIKDLFDEFDVNRSGSLSYNEVASLFDAISNRATSLPAVSFIHSHSFVLLTRSMPLDCPGRFTAREVPWQEAVQNLQGPSNATGK